MRRLVGSEMCIRDSLKTFHFDPQRLFCFLRRFLRRSLDPVPRFKKMYRHGSSLHPLVLHPSSGSVSCCMQRNSPPFCTLILPFSLMCAGSWRLARVSAVSRKCCIRTVPPVLLHPEVLPLPPSQVLPLPSLRSEFLAILAGFFHCSGVGSSSFSAITSPCVERRCLTATQGVVWPTCIIRVPSVIPMGQCGSWWICRTIFPGSAASGKCCRFHLPSSCPNYHRVVGCHLAVPG